jgi:catechol 2,3-dioxygenase-like lactoylglutathione lyase family enzyme
VTIPFDPQESFANPAEALDHVTVAVTDMPAAARFFGLLGFELDRDVVISGPVMDCYMGIDDDLPRPQAGVPRRARGHHRRTGGMEVAAQITRWVRA